MEEWKIENMKEAEIVRFTLVMSELDTNKTNKTRVGGFRSDFHKSIPQTNMEDKNRKHLKQQRPSLFENLRNNET